jgi:hypothetical protein
MKILGRYNPDMTPSPRLIILSLFLFLLGSHFLPARPVPGWTQEQLTYKSRVVCTGVVVKVVATSERYRIQLLTNMPDRVHTMIATVKLTAVIKGNIPSTFQIHYPQVDEDEVVANGPVQIDLAIGKRYRFYLNPVSGKKWYVGALAGEFDDGAAVQPLDPPPPLPPFAHPASQSQ